MVSPIRTVIDALRAARNIVEPWRAFERWGERMSHHSRPWPCSWAPAPFSCARCRSTTRPPPVRKPHVSKHASITYQAAGGFEV